MWSLKPFDARLMVDYRALDQSGHGSPGNKERIKTGALCVNVLQAHGLQPVGFDLLIPRFCPLFPGPWLLDNLVQRSTGGGHGVNAASNLGVFHQRR